MKAFILLLLFPLCLAGQVVQTPNQVMYNSLADNWIVMQSDWRLVFHEDPRKIRSDITGILSGGAEPIVVPVDGRSLLEYHSDGDQGFEISRLTSSGAVMMLYWFSGSELGSHFYLLSEDGISFLGLSSDWSDESIELAKSIRKRLLTYTSR